MPAFMIIENIRELAETFRSATVSPEAVGLAFMSLVLGFDRGKRYADDESEAQAVHVQPRRLRRVKTGAPDLFRLFEGIGAKARQRLECRGKFEENFRSRPKTSAKSTPPATDRRQEESPIRMGDPSFAEPSSETEPPLSQNAREEGERTRQRPSGGKGEPAAARQRPRARKRHRRSATHKTPITSWTPGPADFSFAKERGFNDLRIRQMAEQFYNHASDHGRRSADWPAAWRYWVIRAVELDKRYGDKRTRDEQRAESTRRSDEAIFRAAQRSAARHGTSDRGWAQTIAGNAAG